MGNDEEDLHLQKLRDFIYDEDKIVTFIWLSKELKIGSNAARNLLNMFLKDQRNLNPTSLSTCWVLSGVLRDTGIVTVCLAREQEISEKKSLFESVSSEIIYSVQKAKHLDDHVISMVDNLNITPDPKLLVVGKNCIKRNIKAKIVVPETKRAASVDKTKASHLFGKVKAEQKPSEVKIKTEKISPKQQTENKKTTGLANFFIKGSVNKTEVKPKPELKDDKEPELVDKMKEEKSMKRKTQDFFDSDTDEEAQKVEENNKKRRLAEKKQTNATKRKNDCSSEGTKKRRKRIVERNDSDSDDIFGDEGSREDEDEDIIVSDKEEVMAAKSLPAAKIAPRCRKRKLVEKNFMDEEGYMITTKEWVNVSGTDSEEEKEQKNPQIKAEPSVAITKTTPAVKKDSPPNTGRKGKKLHPANNQKTLMHFFKKK